MIIDQRESYYSTPSIRVIPVDVTNVLCGSDPEGSTSTEGYTEQYFPW